MSSRAGPAWLRAGLVGRPHGLDGSFYVAEPKSELLAVGQTLRVRGRSVLIDRRKGADRRPIIGLDGLTDRSAAEALRGEELLAARRDVPRLDEDEWWADELEGCTVRADGRTVGVVEHLVALPSCEALSVKRATTGAELLVPLVSDAVTNVDVGRKEIEISLEFLGEQL